MSKSLDATGPPKASPSESQSGARALRILIADDHVLFRESLRNLLEAHGHTVIGEAGTGREAVKLARRLHPELLLMDLRLPDLDGLAATRLVRAEHPETKVVVITAYDEDENLFEAIKAGAHGYLPKNLDSSEFFRQLEAVSRGEPALTPALVRRILDEFTRLALQSRPRGSDVLTEREREILGLMVRGDTTNTRLARRLGVSENTIKFHVRNILDKLHLQNRAQAISFALRHHLIEGLNAEG